MKKIFRLFKFIPVWKIEQDSKNDVHYLFALIPVLSIRHKEHYYKLKAEKAFN